MIGRYDVYLASLDPVVGSEYAKTRPVVVVSDDLMNKYLATIVACPLTTKLHPTWRSRLQVVCDGKASEIAIDQIRTISKKRLVKKIDHLDDVNSFKLRIIITEMYGESGAYH